MTMKMWMIQLRAKMLDGDDYHGIYVHQPVLRVFQLSRLWGSSGSGSLLRVLRPKECRPSDKQANATLPPINMEPDRGSL